MKKIIIAVMAVFIFGTNYASENKVPAVLTLEQTADRMYSERNSVTDTAKALETADKFIELYKKSFEIKPSDTLLFKYIRAVDFKYCNFVTDNEAKKQKYKSLLSTADKFCEGNSLCASSNYTAYAYMTLYGRYGELIDIIEAATSGIAGKIKDCAEMIYSSDKSFEGWAASYALGRLHWKAPYIVFVLTWPDKKLSKKYLEEYLASNQDSPPGKMFLADVLWDTENKEKAVKLYREAMNAAPRPAEYFEDVKAIEQCKARAKEIGVQ